MGDLTDKINAQLDDDQPAYPPNINMSGMDRLTADLMNEAAGLLAAEYRANGFDSYGDLSQQQRGSFTLCSIRVIARALAHRRASQAAPAPSDGLREAMERPDGAIHNGRCFMDRIEADYSFECIAGPLSNCADWHELRQCFEHMASYIAAISQNGGAA